MIIRNGLVFTDDALFVQADLEVQEGRIARIAPPGSLPGGEALDVAGGWVLPGLVEIHAHGAGGGDFATGTPAECGAALEYFGRQGVTAVVAALAAMPPPALQAAIDKLLPLCGRDTPGATLQGIRLEGPFLSPARAGAQAPDALLLPDAELAEALWQRAEGWLRAVDIAPELPGAEAFIAQMAPRCVVSLAHTQADYDTAAAAFNAGATHVTHLFNAMPPLAGRQPGPVGAAADKARQVELITDGVHLHPAVVRSTFRLFGAKRVCLISDALSAAGQADGTYTLAGRPVCLEEGRITQADGALAGGAVGLAECCRRAVAFGVPLEHAVAAATINPARAMGLDNELGSLTPGKRADILVWTKDLQTRLVMVGGRVVVD